MKKNKILACLLSGALIFLTAACSSNDSDYAIPEEVAEEIIEETTDETSSDEEGDEEGDEESEELTEAAESLSEEQNSQQSDEEDSTESLITPVSMIDTDNQFTERDLDYSYDDMDPVYVTLQSDSSFSDSDMVSISNNTITISEEGVYVFSGILDDGQIVVNCDDDSSKVQVVLNGVTVTNSSGPCILVLSAGKLFVTTESGTNNILSDTGEEYTSLSDYDKNLDGVIFADCDITFNGSGTLTVNAGYDNGIVSKGNLKITSGLLEIISTGKGIEANDSIRTSGGVVQIKSGDDALNTDNDEEEGKGYIYIEEGTFSLSSGDDGIHAATAVLITGGNITIKESYEGIEGDSVDITGGAIDIISSDDGINASTSSGNGMSGMGGQGGFKDAPGGQNQEEMPSFDENNFEEMTDLPESEDGEAEDEAEFDSNDMEFSEPNGEIHEEREKNEPNGEEKSSNYTDAPDDNLNVLDENAPERDEMLETQNTNNEEEDQEVDAITGAAPDVEGDPMEAAPEQKNPGEGGHSGGGFGDMSSAAYILISGGTITISAQGDGIDSNGDLFIEGGEIYINGPTSGADAAIDYGDGADGYINGGIVVAVGSSAMLESMSEESTQYVVSVILDETAEENSIISLINSEGEELVSMTAEKNFDCVVISCPELSEGTYILNVGDDAVEFKIEDIITQVGERTRRSGTNSHGGKQPSYEVDTDKAEATE